MHTPITNIIAEILPSNESRVTFSYHGEPSEKNCNIRIIDLETELCVYRTSLFLCPGFSYWIGSSPGTALNLSDCRIEFDGDFYYETLISFGNPTQKFIVNNRKFFPKTNGDPAFQTFSEVEIWKIYDAYGVGVDSGDLVVDIGANYGFFSIHAWKKGARKIYALEPFPDTIKCLEHNVKDLPGISVIPVAISDQVGEEEFVQTDVYGSNFLLKNGKHIDGEPNHDSIIKVKTTNLENLISNFEIDRIDFLKVDCEGGEVDLFSTLPEYIFGKLNKIVIEYHNQHGKTVITDILTRHNFSVHCVDNEVGCGMIYCKRLDL